MLRRDMPRAEIDRWLREEDGERLAELWRTADQVRSEHVGDEVHIRGLVEASNYCARSCLYCGLRAPHAGLERYRMTADEIVSCAREIEAQGYGTIVIQTGEDYGITREWLAGVIRRVKGETGLAVTLSTGERPDEDLAAWREAGADRYLLRFETSDRALYDSIHPPLAGRPSDRFAILRRLRELGYEVGTGVMVGIPGQTYASLARDTELFREMDIDMVGVGPFVANPATPLGSGEAAPECPPGDQVPVGTDMTCKVVALTRIVCPEANIPSTTALATIDQEQGRELGLRRGANVFMPNFTPAAYRGLYELYPGKASLLETAAPSAEWSRERLGAIGRRVAGGPGFRKRHA
jgi:biotin synthase